jgi:hypothetical protein
MSKSGAIKIPCQLENFTYRKTTGEWVISFTVQKAQRHFAQPLQDEMESNFVIACVKIKSLNEVSEIMKEDNNGKSSRQSSHP